MTTPQSPIHSGFGVRTTAREALAGKSLAGQVAIVTGGYSGIGLETTRALAEAGASVIVPARTEDKARRNLDGLAGVERATLDLLDPASIDAFARDFIESARPLHMLVHSAGVMACPLMRDGRGHESQFSANHLGHFQLAMRLWPALRRAGGARVVAVSSRGHRIAGVDFDDPDFERREYNKWKAYGQSKSANALFAVALDRRGEADGVRAFSLHPGEILTDLSRHLDDADLRAFGVVRETGVLRQDPAADASRGAFKTVEQGAATSVWCAASDQLRGMGGVYCEDADIAEAVSADSARTAGVRPWATDPEAAERLWSLSEHMTLTRLP